MSNIRKIVSSSGTALTASESVTHVPSFFPSFFPFTVLALCRHFVVFSHRTLHRGGTMGLMMSVYASKWRPKATDLSGRVFLVTVGNSEIRQETVKVGQTMCRMYNRLLLTFGTPSSRYYCDIMPKFKLPVTEKRSARVTYES